MIVLDASVLIAYLSSSDVHHDRAVQLLTRNCDDQFATPALTLAETLVGPARAGRSDAALWALAALDLQVIEHLDPVALALIHARGTVRMPDAVVVHPSQSTGSRLATFDARLAAEAIDLGLTVLGSDAATR